MGASAALKQWGGSVTYANTRLRLPITLPCISTQFHPHPPAFVGWRKHGTSCVLLGGCGASLVGRGARHFVRAVWWGTALCACGWIWGTALRACFFGVVVLRLLDLGTALRACGGVHGTSCVLYCVFGTVVL